MFSLLTTLKIVISLILILNVLNILSKPPSFFIGKTKTKILLEFFNDIGTRLLITAGTVYLLYLFFK